MFGFAPSLEFKVVLDGCPVALFERHCDGWEVSIFFAIRLDNSYNVGTQNDS